MVGYWICKYSKNEDTTLIEYKSFDSGENAVYPELTICNIDPFLNTKLMEIDIELEKEMYIEYLKGEIDMNISAELFPYDKVSLNLFEYLSQIEIIEKFGSNRYKHTCNTTRDCPYMIFKNNYNGFTLRAHQFVKCFGLEIDTKKSSNVCEIQLLFNHTFKTIMDQVGMFYLMFNYPNQMFIFQNKGAKQIWDDHVDNYHNINFFQINSFEILKRRKKSSTPCFADWNRYDDLVLLEKIEKVGCRTPYQSSFEQFPLCCTKGKMKEAIYNLDDIADNFQPPCREVSHLSYTHSPILSPNHYPNTLFPLSVSYPEKIKLITQSQAIDVHSLIGNIGGYIGLFLGMFHFNLKVTFDILSNS